MSRHQLRELGYTDQMIKRRLLLGRLHRIHRGVYAVGSPHLTLDARRMGAVLACGEGALLSHRDAARLHGVLRGTGTGDWHVSAPRLRKVPGVRCHVRTRPAPDDVAVIRGIPVTSLPRTYLDLAADLTAPRLIDTLEEGQRKHIFDPVRLRATIDRCHGHHGIPALRTAIAALDDEPPLVRSGNERLFRELLRAADLPLPFTNVVVAGETVDAVWPGHRLVVEIDSDYSHGLQRDRDNDERRDTALRRAGYRVIRIKDSELVNEPDAVIARLRALLASAIHRPETEKPSRWTSV